MPELIKLTVRNKFAKYLQSNKTKKQIKEWFEEENVGNDVAYINHTKENLIKHYYSLIDWNIIDDINKILEVYAKILNEIEKKIKNKEDNAGHYIDVDKIKELEDFKSDILKSLLEENNIKFFNGKFQITNLADGVKNKVKNIIFAVYDAKPDIFIEDLASNDIKIDKHEDKCLVYDLPISKGLTFQDLFNWYKNKYAETEKDAKKVKEALYKRLSKGEEKGLNSFEQSFFNTYLTKFIKDKDWNKVPALIPQVWLHYDPKTIKELEREGTSKRLKHQKMDFLMLFSDSKRIVIEIDGQQHYANGDTASPKLYAEMVKYDRWMRLKGYEVYRFGGYELTTSSSNTKEQIEKLIEDFFQNLFKKYEIDIGS